MQFYLFQREADPDATNHAATWRGYAEEKLLLPRVVLHLAPAYATDGGKWQLQCRTMFAEAKALLCSPRNVAALTRAFFSWHKDNPGQWKKMVAEAETDPSYLADVVSVDKSAERVEDI